MEPTDEAAAVPKESMLRAMIRLADAAERMAAASERAATALESLDQNGINTFPMGGEQIMTRGGT